MKRVLVVIAWVAGVVVPLALPATPAGATPSAGCPSLNSFSFDETSAGNAIFPANFNAGERVVVSAAPATGSPTAVNLRYAGALVDTAPFPGTVSFTVPADASSTGVSWDLTPASATAVWTVSCSPAPAQSAGCAFLNGPTLDALYGSGGPVSLAFSAGERITFHGTVPFSLASPTGLELRINATPVDAQPFPGTVSFTFPSDTTASIFWGSTPAGNLTWSVTCTPRQPSEGCVDVQKPAFDTSSQTGGVLTENFFAGERISAAAAAPSTGSPSVLTLTVNGVTVDTKAFPGTLQYTFPSDTVASVLWTSGSGTTATWTVDCTPAPVDTAAPTCTALAPRRAPNTPSGRDEQDVRIQDRGTGVLHIENLVITNGTATTTLNPGQRTPLLFTAVKTTPGVATKWSFDVLDEVGTFRHCS